MKRRQFHGRHRERSHAQAHAEGDPGQLPPILEHALVPADQPRMVDTPLGFAQLIDELRSSREFGYDTEFIGEHTYHPQLCVIQVATSSRVTLIDPLASLDLKPFWELIADERVCKIVHAGLHDLEPVMRHLGKPAQSVFDTQIAAAFIGLPYPMATAKLIREMTGADLGSGSKFSQWGHRPLTPVQMQYAANDVRYLPLLKEVICKKLAEVNRLAWCSEECAALSDPALYKFDAHSQRLRVRGVESLNHRERSILRSLLAWREETAQRRNLPSRAFLRDEVMLALASNPIESVVALDRIRGLPRPVESEHGSEIVDAIRRGEEASRQSKPEGRTEDFDRYAHRSRIDSTWKAVQKRCGENAIEPGIVTSRKELTSLVRSVMDGKPCESIDSRLLRGWRRELLAPVLDELRQAAIQRKQSSDGSA